MNKIEIFGYSLALNVFKKGIPFCFWFSRQGFLMIPKQAWNSHGEQAGCSCCGPLLCLTRAGMMGWACALMPGLQM